MSAASAPRLTPERLVGRPLVFMLSGQGSQHHHMGKELMQGDPVFAASMERLDRVARRRLGGSVLDEIYASGTGPGTAFKRTLFTHPAIAMFEVALAEALAARGVVPDHLLGASLGEFVAAALAGALSAEEMLSLVIDHAEAVENDCRPGAMLAVLGPLGLYEGDRELRSQLELAAISFPGHFVLSGDRPAIELARVRFNAAGISCQELAVSHAFHSSLLDAASTRFAWATARLPLRRPTIPIISCAEAGPVAALNPTYFWHVARGKIRLQETAAWLERQGGHVYVDIGPSGTMATLMKYNLRPQSTSQLLPLVTAHGASLETLARLERMVRGPTTIHSSCSATAKSISG